MRLRAVAIVPTYNEAGNVKKLIDGVLAQGADIGIIIADDDSPDGTWEIVEACSKKDPRVHLLRRIGMRGRGTASLAAYKYALNLGAEFIIELDADLSHNPSYIRNFLKDMASCDVLVGSRLVEGGGDIGRGTTRRILTHFANFYIRLILRLPYRDTTSGYKVMRRSVVEAVLRCPGYVSTGPSMLQEVSYIAHREGFRFKEVPIIFEDRRVGKSSLDLKTLLQSLANVPKIRLKHGQRREVCASVE